MIHFLVKNVKYSYNGDHLVVDNSRGNVVELMGVSAKLFLMLTEKKSDIECLNFLLKNGAKSKLEARRLFNSLLYTLGKLRMLDEDRTIRVDGEKFNIVTSMIEITNGCNFRCPHCYVDKQHTTTLSLNKVKNILNDLYNLNASKVLFTGGEVLTHKDFMKMYAYAYDKGFIVSVNTNGSLLNDEIIKHFVKRPPKGLEISLYGNDEETYRNFVKRTGQYEAVIRNIIKLKENNLNVMCKCVITNSNKAFFTSLKSKCEELGVSFSSDYLTFPQINGKFKQNDEQIPAKEALEFVSRNPYSQSYFLRLFSKPFKNKDRVFQCKMRDDAVFINSLGKVNICPCMQSVSYDYKKGNLKDCITKLKELANMRFRDDAKCKNCKFMPICRYCPAKFYLATGDYQIPPSWYCEFAELIYSTYISGLRYIISRYLYAGEQEEYSRLAKIYLNNEKIKVDNDDTNCQKEYVILYNDGKICGFANLSKAGDGKKKVENLIFDSKNVEEFAVKNLLKGFEVQ